MEYCALYDDLLQGIVLEVALIRTGWLHRPRGWQADASAAALRPIVQPTHGFGLVYRYALRDSGYAESLYSQTLSFVPQG